MRFDTLSCAKGIQKVLEHLSECEDVKDFDCACASSCVSRLVRKRWTLRDASQMAKPLAELFSGSVA